MQDWSTIVTSTRVTKFAMDSSTLVFIASLAAAFLILRWLVMPLPQSVPEEFNVPNLTRRNQRPTQPRGSNNSRIITDLMIEVVQAMAPQLTVSQIRYSLQKSGSVEATVNEYMDNGDLPYPPGENPIIRVSEPVSNNQKPESTSKNLLERYGITEADLQDTGYLTGSIGGASGRVDLLQKRRAEMIIRARQRMEKSLTENGH